MPRSLRQSLPAEKARCTKVCARDAQPTVHPESQDAQTTVQEMHNIPTPDAQHHVQRSTAPCASNRGNPNEPQELRSRKPRKAYRKQKESLGAQNQKHAPNASFSSISSVATAPVSQDENAVNEQHLTEREAKKLVGKIIAYANRKYGITFAPSNIIKNYGNLLPPRLADESPGMSEGFRSVSDTSILSAQNAPHPTKKNGNPTLRCCST